MRGSTAESAWDDEPLISGNYVTPLDERMTQPILIAEGMEVPAAPAATPNRVVGDEAKVLEVDWSQPQPLEGLAVDVEITDFPGVGRPAKGRVIEVLGDPDGFGVDVEIIIRKHHLPHVFPANVLAEATGFGLADGGYVDEEGTALRRGIFAGCRL